MEHNTQFQAMNEEELLETDGGILPVIIGAVKVLGVVAGGTAVVSFGFGVWDAF